MDEECTLNNLPLNKSAVIKNIGCKDALKNRIYDFGILENTVITPVLKSPCGDPTAYLIKNSVIALRNNDSKRITVSPMSTTK